MKSFNYDNVMKAQRDGVWIVAPETAVHLTEAWERSRIVYLFFSVVASHGFQGVAHMTTAPGTLDCPPWAAKLRFSQGARPIAFGVKWLATGSVSFDSLQGLRNGTSGCRLAGTALDGTALDVATGYRLARMLQKADKIVKSVVW